MSVQVAGAWNGAAAAVRSIGGFESTVRAQPGAPRPGQVDGAQQTSDAGSSGESELIAMLRRQLEAEQAQLAAHVEAGAPEQVLEQDRVRVQLAATALAAALAEQASQRTSTVDEYA